MNAITKARSSWNQRASMTSHHHGSTDNSRGRVGNLVPPVFKPPVGGSGYYSRAYRYEQVRHYTYWSFVAIRAIINEIAGGDAPNLGTIVNKPEVENGKAVRKNLKNGGRVKKALGGPQEHETFEPYPHDHPLQAVFHNPNGPDVAYDLWAYHTLFMSLMGVSHWYVIRNGFGIPVEIWVVPPHWCQLIVGRESNPEGYIVQSPWGYTMWLPYEDVVTFYEHSPLSRYEGWAASQAVAEWIDTYEAKTRMQLAVFKNGAIPAFHVALGEAYADPDEAFLGRFYAKWFARFQGENNSGLPLVTGADVTVKAIDGHRPADALIAALQTEEMIRDMTLAAYGVPKGVVGVEPVSDVSAYAPQRQFCRFTINPKLKYMGEVITEKIIKATPGCEDGVAYWDDRVANDIEMEERQITSDMADGSLTIEEKRAMRGREPYPHGGKNPFVNGAEMPWVDENVQQQEQPLEAAYNRALKEAHSIGQDNETTVLKETEREESDVSLGTERSDMYARRMSLNGTTGALGGYLERQSQLPSNQLNSNGKRH